MLTLEDCIVLTTACFVLSFLFLLPWGGWQRAAEWFNLYVASFGLAVLGATICLTVVIPE